MEFIQDCPREKAIFIFDLEFIGDVRNLSTCKIWEVAVYSLRTSQWFEAVVDPDPTLFQFPPPPIPNIPQLTREFLTENSAKSWSIVYGQLKKWIDIQAIGAMPVFVSHNTFRADKPILELECQRTSKLLPLDWYFFDSLHFSRRVVKNANGNYSLSGLHQQLFNGPIVDVHRARADVVACTKILSTITNGTWNLQGSIYPTYTTALRTIRWIGQKAEEVFYGAGIRSVEDLYIILQNNARNDKIQFGYLFPQSVLNTLTAILGQDLPQDNVVNIANVISLAPTLVCYTFMNRGGI